MDLILNLLLKIRLKIVTYLLIMVMRETGKESVYCFFFFLCFSVSFDLLSAVSLSWVSLANPDEYLQFVITSF